MNIIETAGKIALKAHEGQMRKDGPPYIIHPFMVALMLQKHGFGEHVIAAALVHDVLEDTDVSEESLRGDLGDSVVDLVLAVTYPKGMSWEEQRRAYIESVRTANDGAKAISIADKIHNAHSLLALAEKEGASLWDRFNRGKEAKLAFEESMLKMFQESWDHPLIAEYELLVKQMQEIPS